MSFMLDEIRQQPEVLDRTLRAELPGVERLKTAVEKRRPRMILLAARGTSDNAAQFGRYLLEISTGFPHRLPHPPFYDLRHLWTCRIRSSSRFAIRRIHRYEFGAGTHTNKAFVGWHQQQAEAP
jgi:hypothetical protein